MKKGAFVAKKRKDKKKLKKLIAQRLNQISQTKSVESTKPESVKPSKIKEKLPTEKDTKKTSQTQIKSDLKKIAFFLTTLILIGIILFILNLKTNYLNVISNWLFEIFNKS